MLRRHYRPCRHVQIQLPAPGTVRCAQGLRPSRTGYRSPAASACVLHRPRMLPGHADRKRGLCGLQLPVRVFDTRVLPIPVRKDCQKWPHGPELPVRPVRLLPLHPDQKDQCGGRRVPVPQHQICLLPGHKHHKERLRRLQLPLRYNNWSCCMPNSSTSSNAPATGGPMHDLRPEQQEPPRVHHLHLQGRPGLQPEPAGHPGQRRWPLRLLPELGWRVHRRRLLTDGDGRPAVHGAGARRQV